MIVFNTIGNARVLLRDILRSQSFQHERVIAFDVMNMRAKRKQINNASIRFIVKYARFIVRHTYGPSYL